MREVWRFVAHSGTLSSGLHARMRRILLTGIPLLLLSCSRVSDVDPALVLERSALASQNLTSARLQFDGTASLHLENDSIFTTSFAGTGALQNAGSDFALTTHASGTYGNASSDQPVTWGTLFSVISLQPGDVFLRVDSLQTDPANPMLQSSALTSMLRNWWQMPKRMTDSTEASLTADPSFLRMQAEIVTVTRDKGFDRIDGYSSHHYVVSLDQQKLLSYLKSVAEKRGDVFDAQKVEADLAQFTMNGELWIDEESYYVRKIVWTIDKQDADGNSVSGLHCTITVTDHGEDIRISPPAVSQPFPSELPLPWLMPSSDIPS